VTEPDPNGRTILDRLITIKGRPSVALARNFKLLQRLARCRGGAARVRPAAAPAASLSTFAGVGRIWIIGDTRIGSPFDSGGPRPCRGWSLVDPSFDKPLFFVRIFT
jgi:hypothetical protein